MIHLGLSYKKYHKSDRSIIKKRHLSIKKSSGGIMHKSKATDLQGVPKNRPTFGHSVNTARAIDARRLVC